MKRILLGCLCLCLLAGAFMVRAEQAFFIAGFEPENMYRNWKTNLFFQRIQEKTGVRLQFAQYGKAEKWQQAKDAMEPGGDLPHLLFKANLSDTETERLYRKGVLIDLAPLIEENMPSFSALMRERPEIREAITLPGGEIAALPYVNESPAQNAMWLNKTWLDALNLKAPATFEELKEVLIRFREDDPNRNGRKDEIPLTLLSAYDVRFLAHAFGLCADDFHLFLKDGKVQYMPRQAEFFPFLQAMRDLYAARLLDRDSLTVPDALRKVRDAKGSNRYGMLIAPAVTELLPPEWAKEYQVLMPLTYEGTARYRAIASPVVKGTFAVTAACPDPAAALRFVDALYSEEGARLATMGLEGEDYVVDGDGTWRRTEKAGASSFSSEALIATGAVPPGKSPKAALLSYADPAVRQAAEQLEALGRVSKLPMPPVRMTETLKQELMSFVPKLNRLADEGMMKFILGEWELTEENKQAYLRSLSGADRLIECFEQALTDGGRIQ